MSGSDIIYAYTRAQAIEDGVLVDLSANFPDLVKNAGIKYHVACTGTVYASCIALTEAAKRAGNDEKGRAWDVLWMLAQAAKREAGDTIVYRLNVVQDQPRATEVELVGHCGPGDKGEPVITIMFPGED